MAVEEFQDQDRHLAPVVELVAELGCREVMAEGMGDGDHLGAVAVAFSYCAANLLALVATYTYHRVALGYRVRRDNVRLLVVTLPGFALAVGPLFDLVSTWAGHGSISVTS